MHDLPMPVNKSSISLPSLLFPSFSLHLAVSGAVWLLNAGVFPPLSMFPCGGAVGRAFVSGKPSVGMLVPVERDQGASPHRMHNR